MSVLCAGNIVLDILTRPVDDITWGGTKWVDAIEQSLGGNGANTSAALARLGIEVKLMGAVGRDPFGDAALARLAECGVSTELVARLEAPTATTVALVRADGTRAFLHRPGVSRVMFDKPVTLEGTASRLHVANPFAILHLRTKAPELLRRARELGWSTSLDTAWDALGEWMKIIEPCLRYTDLLFTNEDEARMLTGATEPAEVARRFRDSGAKDVVLKLGRRGCAVITAGAECHYQQAFKVDEVDTTGAGDCFAGGFLAAIERGLPYPEAARIAAAVGALNVQSLGATSGLLGWEETLGWMGSARLKCG